MKIEKAIDCEECRFLKEVSTFEYPCCWCDKNRKKVLGNYYWNVQTYEYHGPELIYLKK